MDRVTFSNCSNMGEILMNKLIIFLIIFFSALFSTGAYAADGFATASIQNGDFIGQTQYAVEIFLKNDFGEPFVPPFATNFSLGDTTLTFLYDDTALTPATPPISDQDPAFNSTEYELMTVDTTTPGRVSLIITPTATSAGTQVPTVEFLLARIIFDIIDANGTAGITAEDPPAPANTDMQDILDDPVNLDWTGTDNSSLDASVVGGAGGVGGSSSGGGGGGGGCFINSVIH